MRINKATLACKNLNEMEVFYCETLGFPLRTKSSTHLEIAIGESVLVFELDSNLKQKQYHFAFNIPGNLFIEAKQWIQSYVTLLEDEGENEVYFKNADAHSLYFYDPEENVVELMARHLLNPEKQVAFFSAKDIQNISEMSLTSDEVEAVGNTIIDAGIPVLGTDLIVEKDLNFMGEKDSNAFVLLVPTGRVWYFSTKAAKVSPICIEINEEVRLCVEHTGGFSCQQIS